MSVRGPTPPPRPDALSDDGAAARLRLLQLLVIAIFTLLAGQLVRVQLFGNGLTDAGPYERLVTIEVEAARGLIYDRNGVLLARNEPEFSVIVVPGDLPRDGDERRATLLALERRTGASLAEIERSVERGLRAVDPFAPFTVRSALDVTQAIAFRASLAELPGVSVIATPIRVYGGGDLLPQVLGHVGAIQPYEVEQYLAAGYRLDATVGQSGVEATYERELRGAPGQRLVLVDAAGRELEQLGALGATPGDDLVLSIDLELQSAVADALIRGIVAGLPGPHEGDPEDVPPPSLEGAAVVLDVRTGDLLALVSFPSYEVNVFSGVADPAELQSVFLDPARPLVNRAYMEQRSPGSTFKPLVALAALEEGIAEPSTRITSTGGITVRDEYNPQVFYRFNDWMVHGTLDLYGGIARSSDVYFYYLSGGYRDLNGEQVFEGLGAERLAEYSRAAGLGAPTGLDLPGEVGGLVPDAAWKKRTVDEPWVLGDTYTFGIGQGYLSTTPLQMAVLTAAIANGGDVLVPRTVSAFRRGGVERPAPIPTARRLPASFETLEIVREAMRRAALPSGTARTGQPNGLTIGGKTGTAEFGILHADGEFDTHAWYIGFAPFDEPEIAVVVYLKYGIGSTHAGPVAREIFERYFGLGQPSEPKAPVEPVATASLFP